MELDSDEELVPKEDIWLGPVSRPWEDIEEDEEGRIISRTLPEQLKRKRKLRMDTQLQIQRGLLRYFYIIVDYSDSLMQRDFKPNRKAVVIKLLESFITEFFDQNPLCQLGLVCCKNKKARRLSALGGNPQEQIDTLYKYFEKMPEGFFSLQNSLDVAYESLIRMPVQGCKEILVIMGSLNTVDPGDIFDTFENLQRHNTRCSVISLSAEVYVCKELTNRTNGVYGVALSENHLEDLLRDFITPAPIHKNDVPKRTWLQMAFPTRHVDTSDPVVCVCHRELRMEYYTCPRCASPFCELPTTCRTCGLSLISSPLLARSYHHLFPVPLFVDVTDKFQKGETKECFGCAKHLNVGADLVTRCKLCIHEFCIDCDVYVHERLHNCPGCEAKGDNPI